MYGSSAGLDVSTAERWSQDTPNVVEAAEPDDEFGSALASADFNADGRDDLAVGSCFENGGAGIVHMILGSSGGLTATGNRFFRQGLDGLEGAFEAGDRFGCSLAGGDFDGDNRADLVVGSPGEVVSGTAGAGAVSVLYGQSSIGLSGAGSELIHEGTAGMGTAVAAGDNFGSAVTTGDFDGDGRDDLAASTVNEDLGTFNGIDNAGVVHVLYSDASGVTASGSEVWHQNTAGIANEAEAGDQFGLTLESGDFGPDGRDDLVVGVQNEDIEATNATNGGTVHIIPGSAGGLTATGSREINQNSNIVEGPAEAAETFGAALTVGDFDRDNRDDLAVGVPREDVERVDNGTIVNVSNAGLVDVYYAGLAANHDSWDQGQLGGQVEPGDLFGSALVSGDYDGDNRGDLAASAPAENVVTTDAGAVDVIYGTGLGLSAAGSQFLHQGVLGGTPAAGDQFGFQLG